MRKITHFVLNYDDLATFRTENRHKDKNAIKMHRDKGDEMRRKVARIMPYYTAENLLRILTCQQRMGVDPWMDRETFPLLFEVEGTPCVLCLLLFRGRHFCTNAHGIHWMTGAIFVKFSRLILMKIVKIVAISIRF